MCFYTLINHCTLLFYLLSSLALYHLLSNSFIHLLIFIAENENLLVEFYAPWCGHCKQLAPEWAKAAKALADQPIKLSKVDATENKNLAEKYGIRGYPTIKFFKNGKDSDYTGGRTEPEIVSWASKKTGPAAVEVKDEEGLTHLEEAHDSFVLGVFSGSDSPKYTAFLKLAGSNEGTTHFAYTFASSIKSKLAVSDNEESVVVIKSFDGEDEKRADFKLTGDFEEEKINEFINAETTPLLQEFSPENSKNIFKSKITKHVLIFTKKDSDHHESTLSVFKSVAKQYKGQFLFVNVPSSEDKVLGFFDLKESDLPKMILGDMGNESGLKKYPFTEGAFTAASVTEFFESFKRGDIKPSLKSEEVSASDSTGDVVVVKGKSFNELILDNTKDVLIEFYAPWCGHCKKLAPTWDELGKKFKGNDNIVIAKMDATANEVDVPGLSVKGFPTIYYFKGDDKAHPVKYEEGRELDNFVDFLHNNSHNKFNKDEL